MAKDHERIKPNPIIQAFKSKNAGKLQELKGYVGEGVAGKVELYLDLSMETCLEINEEDVIHAIHGEKATEPSLVFVRGEARLTIRRHVSPVSAAALYSEACACNRTEVQHALRATPKPGGDEDLLGPGLRCLLDWAGCYIKCGTKHDDPLLRMACRDSCDAEYRLCRFVGSQGGRVIAPALND